MMAGTLVVDNDRFKVTVELKEDFPSVHSIPFAQRNALIAVANQVTDDHGLHGQVMVSGDR